MDYSIDFKFTPEQMALAMFNSSHQSLVRVGILDYFPLVKASKEIATKNVDLILGEVYKIDMREFPHDYDETDVRRISYWKEVKEEIAKLE
jgi:hypothetical protein